MFQVAPSILWSVLCGRFCIFSSFSWLAALATIPDHCGLAALATMSVHSGLAALATIPVYSGLAALAIPPEHTGSLRSPRFLTTVGSLRSPQLPTTVGSLRSPQFQTTVGSLRSRRLKMLKTGTPPVLNVPYQVAPSMLQSVLCSRFSIFSSFSWLILLTWLWRSDLYTF